ncbi:MAG: OmpA family protein [Cyclobacteriaceae bacterium]|nr:OmpA family protein [Cyclobacteriaceae bacterium]
MKRLQHNQPMLLTAKWKTAGLSFSLLLGLLFSGNAQAQADSIIMVQGTIYDAETRMPVVARITYQSLPYGSRVGVVNNSTYSFPLFLNERYSLVVEASGFNSAKYLIDPAEAAGQLVLKKDIELTKGSGSGSELQQGNVVILKSLIFGVAKAKIEPESYPELDMIVNMMMENKGMVIQLEGHTDYLGDPAKNMKLSQQRVEAVRDYLVKGGVQKNRIKLKAFGGTMPLSRDNTPEGHRMNRRVELRILKS